MLSANDSDWVTLILIKNYNQTKNNDIYFYLLSGAFPKYPFFCEVTKQIYVYYNDLIIY